MKTIFQKKYLKHIFIHICVFISFLAQTAISASNSGIGYHGAPFLKISPAARQVAMGEAFTAFADDVNLMRYNIGGLGQLSNEMLSMNFHNWIDDTQQGSFAFAFPMRYGVIGMDLTYFNEGSITEMDVNFRETGGTATGDDILASLGFGTRLGLWDYVFGVGADVKFLRQTLAGEQSSALAVDVGTQFTLYDIMFGGTIQNIGLTKAKFRDMSSPLPTTFRLGAGYTLGKSESLNINFAGDVAWTLKENLRYYMGSEIILSDLLFLRAGYQLHDVAASPISAGFGLNIPMEWLANSETRIDYAYSPVDALEADIHRFSILLNFGVGKKQENNYDELLQRELEAARQSRMELDKMKDEMSRRLARAQQIAADSDGKIEVEQKTDNKILVSMRINFDFDKSDIRDSDESTVNKVGDILANYPNSVVHVSGHTDSIGTDWYNIRLSQKRITSVINYLKETKHFTDKKFYMPIGYGEMRPVAPNSTEEGRERNRRVEFELFTNNSKPEMPNGSALITVKAINDQVIQIIFNGKVEFTSRTFSSPERLIIDVPNVYMLSDIKEIPLNRGPFIRARLGFHPDGPFTRIVLDLTGPVNVEIQALENFIFIKRN